MNRVRARRVLAFGLALAVFQSLAAQPQPIYRWKDAKGKQHVTNTPPPPGAKSLDVPAVQAPAQPPAPLPVAPAPAAVAAPAPSVETTEWQGFTQRLETARKAKSPDAAAREAESLLDEALWGGIPAVLRFLPIAVFAVVVLLGWWIGSGLRRGPASAVMILAIMAGLALGQVTLSRFLYQGQSGRIQARLNALEAHLGSGIVFRPETRARLKSLLQSLEAKASPLAPPWAFPKEVQALRDFLPGALLEP